MHQSILVLAAHPDDEVLGCGGTIARLALQGAAVRVHFVADGVFSRSGDAQGLRNELEQRRTAAHTAAGILGIEEVSFGDLPDNRLDTVARLDVARAVETVIERYKPDTVLTHHVGDVNIDHRRVHEATVIACRPQPGHCVRTLLFFEVPSSTEWQPSGSEAPFVPNWYVDISATLERKMAALEAYAHELRDWPHPRSRQGVEALAHWRGASAGFGAGEAFVLGRRLI